MYGRKVKLRFFFIFLIALTLSFTIFLVLKSLEENVVFFKSPSEIKTLSEMQNKKIRIEGMVKTDSISIVNKELNFVITDFKIRKVDKNNVIEINNIKKNLSLTLRPYMAKV